MSDEYINPIPSLPEYRVLLLPTERTVDEINIPAIEHETGGKVMSEVENDVSLFETASYAGLAQMGLPILFWGSQLEGDYPVLIPIAKSQEVKQQGDVMIDALHKSPTGKLLEMWDSEPSADMYMKFLKAESLEAPQYLQNEQDLQDWQNKVEALRLFKSDSRFGESFIKRLFLLSSSYLNRNQSLKRSEARDALVRQLLEEGVAPLSGNDILGCVVTQLDATRRNSGG